MALLILLFFAHQYRRIQGENQGLFQELSLLMLTLQGGVVALKSQRESSRNLGTSGNLALARSVKYTNPRYDGGRFTLSPQKRPPFLSPFVTLRKRFQTEVC